VICIDNFTLGGQQTSTRWRPAGSSRVIEHDIAWLWPIPVNTALISSQGIYNCLQAAEWNTARFFRASTSEICGDPEGHPQTENYQGNVKTVGPRSCYDEGKRFAETLVTDFGVRRGLVTRMARIFNTYGPPASHRSSAGPTPLMLVPGSSLCCDGVQRCAHAVDVDIPFHVLGRALTRSASAVQHPVETQYRCYPGSSSVPVPVRSHA
jgi:nucleoside-diphosphate-sugar epimerase